MSLIAVGLIAAAAAGVSGLLAARTIAKRRRAAAEAASEQEQAAADAPAPPDPLEGWPARVGDVIQVGETTRWPRCAILVHNDRTLECALLLSTEAGKEQATAAMAPPDRHLYWLEARRLDMPPSPPGRIEVDGMLLDRKVSFPALLELLGDDPPQLGDSAQFALYRSSTGDVAMVLLGNQTLVFYGPRFAPGEYDLLGQVEG